MLKLFSLLFFTVVNISNINVFEIEGVFSSSHNNGINRFFEETTYTSSDLFVVQYNAADYTNKAVEELGGILEKTPSISNTLILEMLTTVKNNNENSFNIYKLKDSSLLKL